MKKTLKSILLIIILLFGIIINPFLWFISLFISNDTSEYYHTVRKFIKINKKCSEYWHNSFASEYDFIQFEKKIIHKFKPISHTISYSPKPKVQFLFYEYGAESWEGGFIYECIECKSLWELSHPENSYRGYFKSINLNKDSIVKYLENKSTFKPYKL
mgnify:CR=1 FL=1